MELPAAANPSFMGLPVTVSTKCDEIRFVVVS
jgi:hypothetical protein